MNQHDLKFVIAVRHGAYDWDKNLSPLGKTQSERLASKLRSIIPKEYLIAVLSSGTTRAHQTSEIIATALGTQSKVVNELSVEEAKYGEIARQAILKSVSNVDVVVAVTHYDVPSAIISGFSEERFQKNVMWMECGKGNGYMIDLVTGNVVSDILAHMAE